MNLSFQFLISLYGLFSQIRCLWSLNMSRMVISWGTLEEAVGWTIHILRTRMLSLKQVWRHSSWWSSLGMWLKEWDICLPKMLVLIDSAETVIIRYFWMPRVLCWTNDTNCNEWSDLGNIKYAVSAYPDSCRRGCHTNPDIFETA